jgi:hypothetical protein
MGAFLNVAGPPAAGQSRIRVQLCLIRVKKMQSYGACNCFASIFPRSASVSRINTPFKGAQIS